MRLLRFLAVAVLVAGCDRPTASSVPAGTSSAVHDPKADPVPSERTLPTPPAPVVIELKAALLVPLLVPRLGAANARQLAELLDGASLIDVELSADGKGRGLLVHRQKRTLFVVAGTPMRVGLTAAGAASPRAETLIGLPSGVDTLDALASCLTADPGAVTALRTATGLPLNTLLGVYLIETKPSGLVCAATAGGRPGVSRLDLTIDFLRHPAEFRAEKRLDGPPTLTGIDRIGGEDWAAYALRRLTAEGKQ